VVSGDELGSVAGVGYPHTSHCLGSGDIMISTMGDPHGKVGARWCWRCMKELHKCTHCRDQK
jgi:hypothetical protein